MGPTSVITPFSHGVRQGEESGAWRGDATMGQQRRTCVSVIFFKSLFAAQLRGNTGITGSLCACVRARVKLHAAQCSAVQCGSSGDGDEFCGSSPWWFY